MDGAKRGSRSKAGSSLRLLVTRLLLGRAVGRRRVQRAQRVAALLACSLIALALLLLRWTLRVEMTPVLLTPSAMSSQEGKASLPVRRAPLPAGPRSLTPLPAFCPCWRCKQSWKHTVL